MSMANMPDAFFQSKTVIIPKDATIEKGGEDSAETDDHVLVVADGVGGWGKHGIDAGLFAKELTKDVVAANKQTQGQLTAQQLLQHGCKEATVRQIGSATSVVLKLKQGSILDTATLGDAGFALFRANPDGSGGLNMYFKSSPEQIAFNMPYQCGTGSPPAEELLIHNQDIPVEDFDIVVAYSDGFDDNVYPEEIPSCIQRYMNEGLVTSLSRAADCLARKAHLLGKNKAYLSPFNAEWKRAFERGDEMPNLPPAGYNFMGGKEDDVTVIVAQIFSQDMTVRPD